MINEWVLDKELSGGGSRDTERGLGMEEQEEGGRSASVPAVQGQACCVPALAMIPAQAEGGLAEWPGERGLLVRIAFKAPLGHHYLG